MTDGEIVVTVRAERTTGPDSRSAIVANAWTVWQDRRTDDKIVEAT